MAINLEMFEAWQKYQAGQIEAAESACRRALAADPNDANALHLLGLIAFQTGQADAGNQLISRAMVIQWSQAAPHFEAGNAFKSQGRWEDAAAAFRRALEIAPLHFANYTGLGSVLQLQGKVDESVDCFRKAAELNPADAFTQFSLGDALKELGQLEAAIVAYRRALELAPNEPAIYGGLGFAFLLQGKLAEAIRCFERGVELQPGSAVSYSNLGGALQNAGRLDETIACLRKALELKPDHAKARSNLLHTLQYRSGVTLAELAAAHAEFEKVSAAPLRAEWQPQAGDRDSERPIMLGFMSPCFSQHPVGHFVIRAVENLDRERFKVVCYSDRIGADDWTKRFQAASAVWRDTNNLSQAELAEQIRADRIDILFDLAGHTAKNRLLVCARKPAPIQITWADYVGTTGLAAIDYLLADRYEVLPEAEAHYCERVLRMPNGYICYDPPPYAPAVTELPAVRQGFVTFSSFNHRPKITFEMVEVWAQILRRVPGSRLVLKNRGMDDAAVAGALRAEFRRQGIEPGRIECQGWSAHAQLLAEYQRIDLALDTFPYNGGLTTCEALWMGVPVITCPGETFASRHSLSHLSNAGLTDTIARDLDEYVDVAVGLATDLPRLAGLRKELRTRVAASPLCDGKRFADDLMHVLRGVWREWCERAAI
jgi:predicted O-linked N-acetylglucosamine transferase (SPINDLY family)